jgi:O-antigen/teichoic acid export membrane protein
MRVAGWPASLVGASVADVFHEGLAGAARIERGQVSSVLWTSAKHLAGVGVLIYLPVALLSPLLFGVVFGAQWQQAGTLMVLLSPYLFVALVTSPLSRLLLVVDRQEWKLVVDLVCLAVPVAAFYGGQRAGLSFLQCVALFSGLNVLAYTFYFTVIAHAARRFSAEGRNG